MVKEPASHSNNNSCFAGMEKISKFGIKEQRMTAVAIRKKLVSYMQIADEKTVKAIYALLQEDIEQEGRISITQYNKELAEAEAEFAQANYISHAAMKKNIKQW